MTWSEGFTVDDATHNCLLTPCTEPYILKTLLSLICSKILIKKDKPSDKNDSSQKVQKGQD